MRQNKSLHRFLVTAITCLLITSAQLSLAKAGHLKVTTKVQKMLIVKKDGKTTYQFHPTSKVLPGETVQYNTFYENIGNQAAANIDIINPIPKHLVYLPNSARGENTAIMFSVDGGKHYGKAETLKVRGSDGKLYPAKPSNYTHIKWKYLGSLAPKTKKEVTFRARLL